MITSLRIRNFKSWRDTGDVRSAPLTGFFGPNSSGKTAILQFLLLLKQTVESTALEPPLFFGDDKSYVDLGSFADVIHQHEESRSLSFELAWTDFHVPQLLARHKSDFSVFAAALPLATYRLGNHLSLSNRTIGVDTLNLGYHWNGERLDIAFTRSQSSSGYDVVVERSGNQVEAGRQQLPGTIDVVLKHHIPLSRVRPSSSEQLYDTGLQSQVRVLSNSYESVIRAVRYLGPLRESPHRTYVWSGSRPQDVGQRGELAVAALLASKIDEQQQHVGNVPLPTGVALSARVAEWLKTLGLISSFEVRPISQGRREHEVVVRHVPGGPEVPITDVGFGVSQILPVIVLCYYAPPGSILLFEQPEIHLHPSVQAGLADVFIDAIKTRSVQIILESHSEHLLRRLQRRIAEEKVNSSETALYFCEVGVDGASAITSLELDEYGNVANWPKGFFGDEMADVVAQTEAEMQRRAAEASAC